MTAFQGRKKVYSSWNIRSGLEILFSLGRGLRVPSTKTIVLQKGKDAGLEV